MPELPAVEYSRRLLLECFANCTIASVSILEDSIIFEGVPSAELAKELEGRTVINVERYGKYLWLCLDQNRYLLMHFGMTGFVEVQGLDRLHYRSAPEANKPRDVSPADAPWPPRFCKLEATMLDGRKFAFGDARRLGRIKMLHQHPREIAPVLKLGFDPIICMPPYGKDFIGLVKKRSVPLKFLLLDQSFAAGVGNWMADDIMLAARLHPEVRSDELDEDEIKRLHGAIHLISVKAVEVNSDGSKFPDTWLFHHRWPAERRKQPQICGHKVQFITVAGRTTAYVPAMQEKKRIIKSKGEDQLVGAASGPKRKKAKDKDIK